MIDALKYGLSVEYHGGAFETQSECMYSEKYRNQFIC